MPTRESVDEKVSVDVQSQSMSHQHDSVPTIESFAQTKWQRYHFDQRSMCKSEGKEHISSTLGDEHNKSVGIAESIWQEPTEDMLHFVNSEQGVCRMSGIRFHLSRRFTAGAYVITCKDVTQGLPPRMLAKTVKVLLKIVDLTDHSEQLQEVSAGKQSDPKKKAAPVGRK